MAITLQIACDAQGCDVTDESGAGVLEGNVPAERFIELFGRIDRIATSTPQ